MNRYRITIETEHLVSTGIVSANNEDRAWHLFKMSLYDQNPEHIAEIDKADPMFRILGEADEIKVSRYGNGVEEITIRL